MRVWRLILGVALSVITGTAQAADGGARVDERLVYEIVVTAPGTRSQGWHGTIYDSTGKPVSIEPGQRFETAVGTFESVACPHLWSMCGMIHTDMLAWMKTHDANVIMGREPWAYRLFVLREGTKSEGFEGKIFFNGVRSHAVKRHGQRQWAPSCARNGRSCGIAPAGITNPGPRDALRRETIQGTHSDWTATIPVV